MIITQRHIKMINPAGFDEIFEQELPKHDTYELAYEALEEEYQEAFHNRRYSNYESYRRSRVRRLKAKRDTVT